MFKKFMMVVAAGLLLMSCGGSEKEKGNENTKEISPTSTEFASGDLVEYIEFVDQPSELVYVVRTIEGDEYEDPETTYIVQMKATLKLVKELEEDLKMSDFSFRSWETLVAVILVDEYGVDLEGLEMREEDESKVKKLLKGKADDTVEVTFERKFDEYDEIDVPKFFGMVAAFRPYSEAEIYVPKEDSSNSYSVSSSSSSDNASVAESSSSYEVETASAPSSSSSNSDIDEFLDDYEEYVDKYISYAKKAANGDLSAMTEYVSLMEKAQSLSEKINNMSGEMSSAQMTRYTKITAKMASAAGM